MPVVVGTKREVKKIQSSRGKIIMKNNIAGINESITEKIYEAYIYGLPLVVLELHTKALTNTVEPNEKKAPLNQFLHGRDVATARDREVVHPNIDTVYSKAHLNLKKEPLYIHKPAAERYVMAEIIDAWGNCIDIVGSGGIGGNGESEAVLVGPDYQGEIPEELPVIHIPTNASWILARVLKNGNDENEIKEIQQQLYLKPLSEYRNSQYVPPKGTYNPEYDFIPYDKFAELEIEEFFNIFNSAIGDNLGRKPDVKLLKEVEQYGIGEGKTFSLNIFESDVATALKNFYQRAVADMTNIYGSEKEFKGTDVFEKNWRFTRPEVDVIANFKWNYLVRAKVAWGGFGALPATVAIYPKAGRDDNGDVLTGKNKYIVHFESEPPVDEFWSLTVYGADQFLIDNELDKNGINDRSDLKKAEDGSFDLYLQKDRPEEDKIKNWLPVGDDEFELVLRTYYAKNEFIDGVWKMPSIIKVS